MRQTVIVLDQAHLKKSDDPAGFRAANGTTLDAILALADPELAVAKGLLAPRERVSVLLVPTNDTAPTVIFTGCAPAYSESDVAKLQSGSSAVARGADTFIGQDLQSKVAKQAEAYRMQLVGAINVASQMTTAAPAAASSFAESSLLKSLKAAPRLYDAEEGVPRIFLLAPEALGTTGSYTDARTARAAGFAAANSVRLDLGDAEVSVALAPAGANRDYIDAFLLGSSGNLYGWSGQMPTDLPKPPVTTRNFRGEIKIGTEIFPAQARISLDQAGHLVNSWLEMRSGTKKAIPMTGIATCDSAGNCLIRSDDGGFAHRFDADPDPKSVGTDPSNPFGGMRNFEMTVSGKQLNGRIFDPLISGIKGQDRNDFTFTLNEGI